MRFDEAVTYDPENLSLISSRLATDGWAPWVSFSTGIASAGRGFTAVVNLQKPEPTSVRLSRLTFEYFYAAEPPS